jgi:predicted NUDIX family NTP pyrophosphohydrolase
MFTVILALAVGVASGITVNAIWVRRNRLFIWVADVCQGGEEPPNFEPHENGFYVINRWSPARVLTRQRLETIVAETRPVQTWLNQERWEELRDEFAAKRHGEVCYLIDYDIDHHESAQSLSFRMYLARCSYAEYLATARSIAEDELARTALVAALDRGRVDEVVRSAPPSAISMDIAVVSPRGTFLAVRRSAAVDTAKGLWTVGASETMKLQEQLEPGAAEDLFSLAERGLNEELGLLPEHYGQIYISWLGFHAPLAQVTVCAHTKARISEREVNERIGSSHSVFEVDQWQWLPVTRAQLFSIVNDWRGDAQGREWTAGSRLSAQELWRMRRVLALGEE